MKEENNRLKELLRKNNIDYTNEHEKILTTDDKIKIYLSYFKGRNDVYAEKYIKDGKKAYAIYPVINNNCYFLAIDFDDKEFKDCALAYKKECDKDKVSKLYSEKKAII